MSTKSVVKKEVLNIFFNKVIVYNKNREFSLIIVIILWKWENVYRGYWSTNLEKTGFRKKNYISEKYLGRKCKRNLLKNLYILNNYVCKIYCIIINVC